MKRRAGVPSGRAALPVVVALSAALLGGCVQAEDDTELTARCSELAASVAQARLGGSPSQQQAQAAAQRLDTQMLLLPDPGVHDAAVSLHFHLHVLDFALGGGNQAQASKSLQDTRKDTTDLAKACKLSPAEFGLG